MLAFSRNTVRIEIQDPDEKDLSFVNLPGAMVSVFVFPARTNAIHLSTSGLIQYHEDPDVVGLVRDLVVCRGLAKKGPSFS